MVLAKLLILTGFDSTFVSQVETLTMKPAVCISPVHLVLDLESFALDPVVFIFLEMKKISSQKKYEIRKPLIFHTCNFF